MIHLIVTGILALPALLVILVSIPIIAILSIPVAYLLLTRKQPTNTSTITKKQIIVTGGSSGIGLSLAKLVAADCKDITRIVILARNQEKLDVAKNEILSASKKNTSTITVDVFSVDVTKPIAVEKSMSEIFKDIDCSTTKTHLYCCAGEPHPAYYQDISPESYEKMVQINQLGAINVTNAALKYMQIGTIMLCSSMGGQLGVFGMSAYSPSKFALRGYAECMHMELLNNPNIHIQVAYPPDTDTPGFAQENEGKPAETALISETAGLSTAEHVASVMMKESILSKYPKFNVYFNFDGFLLCTLTAGFNPVTGLVDCIAQLSMTTFVRWIALFYLNDWHRLIRNYYNNNSKEQQKKLYGTMK